MILQVERTRIGNELTQIDAEISKLQRELEIKRQNLEVLKTAESSAVEALGNLKLVLTTISEVSPDAIATLKSAVLGIFPNDGNDGSGNQPNEPTPPDNPDSDNSDEPELLCLNGLTGDCLLSSDEFEPEKDATELQAEALEPKALHPGDRFWFGGKRNAGTIISALSSQEYLCQIDGAIREVTLERERLQYIDEPLVGQTCDWYEAPKVGQACELPQLPVVVAPFIELITHFDNPRIAYLRKQDGEIICTYFGFRTKAIAQSWQQFLEAIAHRIELRQSQRMQRFKWELKAKGMSANQLNRLAKNCDFSKAYQPQAPKSESSAFELGVVPPSDWGKAGSVPVLEKNDTCEVLMGRFTGQISTVAAINQFSEKPITVSLPGGHSKHFLRSELKFISKGEPEAQPRRKPLQTGDVLMGDRVVTSGAFIGVAATLRANNASRGLETKLADAQLMKSGLTPELAMATATGNQIDDDYDF